MSWIQNLVQKTMEKQMEMVLFGLGDPNDGTSTTTGAVYHDTSTTPATVWYRRKNAWQKCHCPVDEVG